MAELFLEAVGIQKEYGTRRLFEIDRFELYDGDRIGLVGENGAGKSTFLDILGGSITPEAGYVRRMRPVSRILQMGDSQEDTYDAHMKSEFQAQEMRGGLSGGEMTRRRIAGALSASQGILLADEPTSDLDMAGVERLEKRLMAFRGALLLVSHDRALLNRLCTQIAALEGGKLVLYPGNYDQFVKERERRRAFAQFEYDQYRAERSRLQAAIQGKKEHAQGVGKLPTRMGNSEARLHRRSATEVEEKLHKTRKALESRLSQLEEKERPKDDPDIRMRLGAQTPISGAFALEAKGIALKVGEEGRVLLKGAQMKLPTGSKTALMGPNGCGKTTLIEHLRSGAYGVRIAPTAKIGYFGQDHQKVLSLETSVLENVMRDSLFPASQTRTVLARLGIRGDDVHKRVGVLSGGERAKTAMCKLLVGDINLLVLDEPTNHLDIYALEALTNVLASYEGTLLLVSHDREFVKDVADRLIIFEGEKLVTYPYGLSEMEREKTRDVAREKAELERDALRMRMAVIASKIGSPGKGEDVARLDAEYKALAEKLRGMQGDSSL